MFKYIYLTLIFILIILIILIKHNEIINNINNKINSFYNKQYTIKNEHSILENITLSNNELYYFPDDFLWHTDDYIITLYNKDLNKYFIPKGMFDNKHIIKYMFLKNDNDIDILKDIIYYVIH